MGSGRVPDALVSRAGEGSAIRFQAATPASVPSTRTSTAVILGFTSSSPSAFAGCLAVSHSEYTP